MYRPTNKWINKQTNTAFEKNKKQTNRQHTTKQICRLTDKQNKQIKNRQTDRQTNANKWSS